MFSGVNGATSRNKLVYLAIRNNCPAPPPPPPPPPPGVRTARGPRSHESSLP
ncbi:hypothetical protein JYU34_010543 [Plutella xylostella]|uniref:Uncharacterized protein n=1 Tax=Plutella xylostella TaxID=51655 RepID=A0ABQ7QIL1_PLUXY|nr:hypothetical protein JYU34_010543 [Plutella xylostella]